MLRTILWFSVAGLLVAVGLELIWRSVGYYTPNGYVVERTARILWPTSIFKMTLSGENSAGEVFLVYASAIIANGLLYGVLGSVVGLSKNLWVKAH